jgi:FkbM family methyltransferase
MVRRGSSLFLGRGWPRPPAAPAARPRVPTWQQNIMVAPGEEPVFHVVGYLRRLFNLLRIDCVLDVGANLGQYHDFLRDKVGYTGLIVSFEPIPSHAQILRDRAQQSDPDWRVEGCALGAAPGTLKFNVMADSQFSSFLTPSHREVALFRDMNKVTDEITVEVRTLDTIIPRLRQKNLYLNLDTQGFDLAVIKGARRASA